jgi:hypothetical protein
VVEDSPEIGQNAKDQAAASEAPKESTNKGADVDDDDESAKPEPASEMSPVVNARPQSDFVAYIVDTSGDVNKFK